MAGLDGLRAVAVIAVVLYHGQDLTGISSILKPQGGFLGVEVFFVISGFLITSLLVAEHDKNDTIDLKRFWFRRARRLLPALYVFLGGTIALAALFGTDALDKIRREILGAVFYASNWLLIATDESYFEAAGRPSLLRHLWSLAIEEQFYLVWPLIVMVCLRFGGRRTLLAFSIAGVAASTALLWMLFDGVERYGDVTSVYFRTDARAAALLIGSALALVWQPWRQQTEQPGVDQPGVDQPGVDQPGMNRWILDVLGVAALAMVVVLNYAFTDRVIEWASYERLYHGGFLALSASTVVVIAAVANPGSQLGWILGNPVMRWIGTRSYAIYLWHWPIFQLTRPRVDVDIDGYLLLGVRLAITAAITEVSYRLVEVPIRQRRFVAPVRSALRTPRGIALGSVGALALIMATTAVAVAIPTIDNTPTNDTATEVQVAAATEALPAPAPEPVQTPKPTTVPTPEPTPEPEASPVAQPTPSSYPPGDPKGDPSAATFDPATLVIAQLPTATPTQPPLPPPPPLSQPFDISASQIHIVGDSVIEGAQGQLYRISPRVTVDGRIGRQWWEAEAELRQMRAAGLASDVVVIQLGNNGNFSQQMFDGVMNALSGTRLVLFINVRAPVVWEQEVNRLLAGNVNRYPEQARLLDWYSISNEHPEYFIDDGTHLQGPGQVAFRLMIENALLSLS